VLRIVGSIGILLVLASEDVVELCNLLGLKEVLPKLGGGVDVQSKLVQSLSKEVDALLET
jgi:hypothetical protein